ncbi:hypothetical protein RN001_000318 [Aquatica leii]|uniref:ISXO2-like transposase domain-containing protein n=1 Tax=Aquatica leii TaxID=1421715 RepID=A0AAN7Q6Z4_9COLE|nr:hypothetical protein RN001_000318 [Aquatica leii]
MDIRNHFQLCVLLAKEDPTNGGWVVLCQDVGLFLRDRICPHCGDNAKLVLEKSKNMYMWRCRKRGANPHDFKESLAKNTLFAKTKLPVDRVLHIIYFFAFGENTYDTIIRESSTNDVVTSRESVVQWMAWLREVCFIWLDRHFENEGRIGGPGVVVEIDETKIGKRKYNRGRNVDGHWIVGMVEIDVVEGRGKGGRFRLEICKPPALALDGKPRGRLELEAIIRKHVEPGYNHLTVNHQTNFIDPNTFANTQTIESQWRPLKYKLRKEGVRDEYLAYHLCEYLWRRHFKETNLFMSFLRCAAEVYNPAVPPPEAEDA